MTRDVEGQTMMNKKSSITMGVTWPIVATLVKKNIGQAINLREISS